MWLGLHVARLLSAENRSRFQIAAQGLGFRLYRVCIWGSGELFVK